jgi:hypothetical protein
VARYEMRGAEMRTFKRLLPVLILLGCTGQVDPAPQPEGPEPRSEGPEPRPEGPEPIAFVGHGELFGVDGRPIVPTARFVEQAQSWYRAEFASSLDASARGELASFEARLRSGIEPSAHEELVLEQRVIDWIVDQAGDERENLRVRGKLNALQRVLSLKLPEVGAGTIVGDAIVWDREQAHLAPSVVEKLKDFDGEPGGMGAFLATANLGQDYIDECKAAQVPIPPPINKMDPAGTTGWKSWGFIPQNQLFIDFKPAEVRTFESADGMCIALPRYNDDKTLVRLDGVICLSSVTSKVCMWDNQMGGAGFNFSPTELIPIGVPDTSINPGGKYQAGGFELEGGSGGVCTDCHAGENPYIVHPDAELELESGVGTGVDFGELEDTLPMFTPNRYVPLVPASWPQNDASMAESYTPSKCTDCHSEVDAGRLPHLSDKLIGYCTFVLANAVANPNSATMPTSSPGSLATNPAIMTFQAMCNAPPNSSAADLGDPHLNTVNGVKYDFQSAGEFVALRNSDSGLELQMRQTPVTTTFVPSTNAYTGLQSCVSLNTAAALRLGEHRVSYQQGDNDRMELRVDGRLTTLTAAGLDLGDGNRLEPAMGAEGIDVRASDGTHLLITSKFWNSQGYWFLSIDVLSTPSREGTLGYVQSGDWLPLGPGGVSFGPKPAAVEDRDVVLNQRFADAWRVRPGRSLFDYTGGTTTNTFTDKRWPPPHGTACTSSEAPGPGPVTQPLKENQARQLCEPVIMDAAVFEACVFDVMMMGEPTVAEAYERLLAARRNAMP